MNSNYILCTIGIIALIAFIIVIFIQNYKTKVFPTISTSKSTISYFSDSELGISLNNLVSSSTENSQMILKSLKMKPTECAKEFTSAYSKLPINLYNERWLMVYYLSQFEQDEYLPLLQKIASSEIPSEKSKIIHQFSTVSEETTIRLRAIEGIKNIAKSGNNDAEMVLLKMLKSNYLALVIASCQSLLDNNEQNMSKVIKFLPEENHYIIKIKRKNISDVYFEKYLENSNKINNTDTSKPG